MDQSLARAARELAVIRAHVAWSDAENALIYGPISEQHLSQVDALNRARNMAPERLRHRQFLYSTTIVTLYGALERFAEDLIVEHVASLNTIVPTFDELPKAIQKSHTAATLDLAKKAEAPNYFGKATTSQLVHNLSSCFSSAGSYILNGEAFAQHSSNFRLDTISRSFSQIGIDGAPGRLRHADSLSKWLEQTHGTNATSLGDTEAFSVLNDLVERRNLCAHGVTADDLLNTQSLLDLVDFLQALFESMNQVANCSLLEQLVRHKAVALGSPIEVHNGSIVCFELKDAAIRVGDVVIASTADLPLAFRGGVIESLQIDRTPVQQAQPPARVGAKVPFRAKLQYKYFVAQTRTQADSSSSRQAEAVIERTAPAVSPRRAP